MQDWRITDGYYHYQPDMSSHPAYPLRLSARDMARLGQLFAGEGLWDGQRVLSADWVRRSRASYSHNTWMGGYSLMWWVFENNPLARFDTYAALGVGQQMIAVLPALDMVIVNRTDTYDGDDMGFMQVVELVLATVAARTGERVDSPELTPLPLGGTVDVGGASADDLKEFAGTYHHPPPSLGSDSVGTYELTATSDQLVLSSDQWGTFR
jgi:hypothetical protein